MPTLDYPSSVVGRTRLGSARVFYIGSKHNYQQACEKLKFPKGGADPWHPASEQGAFFKYKEGEKLVAIIKMAPGDGVISYIKGVGQAPVSPTRENRIRTMCAQARETFNSRP